MVLGSVVAEKVFGEKVDPVGKDITLWNQTFKVVGVVTSASWVVRPAAGDDEFDAVYMPYTTTHQLLNLTKLNDIIVTAASSGEVSDVSKRITELLRQRHGITEAKPDDFTISTQATRAITTGGLPPNVAAAIAGNVKELERVTLEQLAGTLERASGTMRWLLAAVAAVSLLVGGIGIMNITLLSVTERTKEIGLRMAVGARGRDVTRQFLTEAVAISLAGGAVGVVLGLMASVLHRHHAALGHRGVARRGLHGLRRLGGRRRALWLVSGASRRRTRSHRRPAPRIDGSHVLRLLAVSGQIAWKALGRNRLRSGLTTLGVVIGVAAVIAMVALGNGAAASVERTLKTAGTSIVQVSSGNFTKGGESMNIASGLGSATTLTRADAAAIGRLDERRARGRRPALAHLHHRLARGADLHARQRHRGFTGRDSWLDVARGQGLHGRRRRGRRRPKRCSGASPVRGSSATASIPTGKVVKIHDRDFVVVGMMRAVDADQDEAAFVPVTTLGALTSRTSWLQTITVGVTEAGVATSVADAITALLRERHADHIAAAVARASGALGGSQMPGGGNSRMGPADDFVVKTLAAAQVTKGLYTEVAAFALANMPKLDSATMEEMSGTLNRAGTTMTALLASIAAISLVVGGIGIMNIMLVSVTERTREIGLRLAMGARRKDVLVQFLVEAVALSLIGGLVGIAAGIGAARGLTALMSWPTEVSAQAIGLAFAISALIGVAFGFYPARRASRLDPIVALRRE